MYKAKSETDELREVHINVSVAFTVESLIAETILALDIPTWLLPHAGAKEINTFKTRTLSFLISTLALVYVFVGNLYISKRAMCFYLSRHFLEYAENLRRKSATLNYSIPKHLKCDIKRENSEWILWQAWHLADFRKFKYP